MVTKDHNGLTLHYAVYGYDTDIVELLALNHGANCKAKDHNGLTPLHTCNLAVPIIQILPLKGADCNIKDDSKKHH